MQTTFLDNNNKTIPSDSEEYMNWLAEIEETDPETYKKEMGYEEEPKKRKRTRIKNGLFKSW